MRLASLVNPLVDFCYPPVCALCGSTARMMPLCENCNAHLNRLAAVPACDCCGYPLVAATDPCPHCRGRGIAPIKRVARLGVFNDPLRTLVHRIKFRHGWPVAEFVADRLAVHAPAKAVIDQADYLIAVPLHPMRQWARGYNQAAVIADRLSKICRKPTRMPLVRLRNTQPQTLLRAHDKRADNVRNAFGLLEEKSVRGKHVVLVDDVMTTGATVRSAARTLAGAKPASISVIAVAVADPKGRAYEAI